MSAFAPDPGVAVLRLQGDGDAEGALKVRSELQSALRGSAPVVVDLTAATSLDVTVMRILLDGLAETEKDERSFVLLVPDDELSPVRRLFEITGLISLLPVASSWSEALGRAGRQGTAV